MNLNEPLVIRVFNEWRKGCPNTWGIISGKNDPPWHCWECTWGAIKAAARDLLWAIIGKPSPRR